LLCSQKNKQKKKEKEGLNMKKNKKY